MKHKGTEALLLINPTDFRQKVINGTITPDDIVKYFMQHTNLLRFGEDNRFDCTAARDSLYHHQVFSPEQLGGLITSFYQIRQLHILNNNGDQLDKYQSIERRILELCDFNDHEIDTVQLRRKPHPPRRTL